MKITITKKEYSQFYIYNYYHSPKKTERIVRMYLGVTMTTMGLYMFYAYSEQINAFVIGLIMAYGIFYSLKPIIMTWANKTNDESFSYTLDKYNLHLKDRVKEGNIDLRKHPIQENKRYFYVKLESGQFIFFPKYKLNDKIIALFRDNMIA